MNIKELYGKELTEEQVKIWEAATPEQKENFKAFLEYKEMLDTTNELLLLRRLEEKEMLWQKLSEKEKQGFETWAAYEAAYPNRKDREAMVELLTNKLESGEEMLTDEEWCVLNFYQEQSLNIVAIFVGENQIAYNVESEFELFDDETKKMELVPSSSILVLDYLQNKIVMNDSYLNYKYRDEFKNMIAYENILDPRKVNEEDE